MEMELPMGKEFLTWDEFSPALYKLTAKLTNGKQTDTQQVQFGMRDFKIEGKWFYVNGRKTMLRVQWKTAISRLQVMHRWT